jgi:hypothetical protein
VKRASVAVAALIFRLSALTPLWGALENPKRLDGVEPDHVD